MRAATRTLRYARSWLTGRAAVGESPLPLLREDRPVAAALFSPAGRTPPLPTWILLHGATRSGIAHPQLVRFARALAASGARVLVPEVPEWRELRLAPEATLPTLVAAVRALRALPGEPRPVGLAGFSFGGPQAIVAAAHEAVAEHVAGVVCFGGYCDLERTLRFHFTGEHEWQGRLERREPDPYGRWLAGASYLASAPGYGDALDVAGALRELALAAGDVGSPAGSPVYDELKARLEARLPRERRGLFRVFAPPAGRAPPAGEAQALVEALTAGGRRTSPLMEPTGFLARARHPVQLLHGRSDDLMPYTESLRLAERLPERVPCRLTITGLFSHTRGERVPLAGRAWELVRFLRALGRVLDSVD